jgi:hypothetical protein
MRGGKQGIRDLSLLKFGLDLLPYARNVAARFGIVPKLPERGVTTITSIGLALT